MNILFVCTGNTCRSPLAEAILRKKIIEDDLDIKVKSAGVFAIDGGAYSKHTQTIIKAYSDNLGKSKLVTDELIDWADYILTMTNFQKEILIDRYPLKKEKIHTLKASAKDIADPFGGELDEYQTIALEIEEAINNLLEKYIKDS